MTDPQQLAGNQLATLLETIKYMTGIDFGQRIAELEQQNAALMAASEAFKRWYLIGDIYLPEVKKLTEQALAQVKQK